MRTILSAVLVAALAAAAHADQRPNLILIVADDVGRDWVSCYGARHPTPNIDRLAKRGVRYETAWCTPIGTPTRVTLLTGQYPFRHGWTKHPDVLRGRGLSWTKFTTVARVLRDSGYATAIGGRWQVNHLGQQPDALQRHGFDEHCVWPGAESGIPDSEPSLWDGLIITNGVRETVSYGPDTVSSFLIEFIKRQTDRQPFFIYYPMLLTHEPPSVTPTNRNQSRDDKEALFSGNVSYVDELVGKLMGVVDQEGLAGNTLIVFTSDNGSATAGVLNGQQYEVGKGQGADRGVHVPFIVSAPFLTAGDRVSRDLIDCTDLYPTFLELANADTPAGTALDGKSFVPSLKGSEDPYQKRSWVYSQVGKRRMIRDWHHFLDSEGNFHDLTKDPLQRSAVSPLDKIAPGRRQRLEMILKRFPPDSPAPFPESAEKQSSGIEVPAP